MDQVFASFNDVLLKSPLVFADEHLPTDSRNNVRSTEIRRHIQEESRSLTRKYLPVATLVGATRTVIAANNEDILRTQENLTVNDIGAITDRYLYIPAGPEAKEFLEATDTSTWISGDAIAAHALWLRDNLVWEPQGRFLIPISDEHLTRSLIIRAGVNSTMCQWLCGFLINPQPFLDAADHNMLVRVYEGRLLVSTQGVLVGWKHYVGNESCPRVHQIANSLVALSTGERKKLKNALGAWTNYRIVDERNLVEWVEHSGFTTVEQIVDGLSRDTPMRGAAWKKAMN
jgi:hypothetical protein